MDTERVSYARRQHRRREEKPAVCDKMVEPGGHLHSEISYRGGQIPPDPKHLWTLERSNLQNQRERRWLRGLPVADTGRCDGESTHLRLCVALGCDVHPVATVTVPRVHLRVASTVDLKCSYHTKQNN